MNTPKICGREFTTHIPPKHLSRNGAKPRYTVSGINHPKAGPIRFKSIDRAERHILNMRLALPMVDED